MPFKPLIRLCLNRVGFNRYMTETCKEDQMAPSDSLPDDIVHFMLERESILTKAKLLVLQFEKQKCIYESRDLNNLTDEVHCLD